MTNRVLRKIVRRQHFGDGCWIGLKLNCVLSQIQCIIRELHSSKKQIICTQIAVLLIVPLELCIPYKLIRALAQWVKITVRFTAQFLPNLSMASKTLFWKTIIEKSQVKTCFLLAHLYFLSKMKVFDQHWWLWRLHHIFCSRTPMGLAHYRKIALNNRINFFHTTVKCLHFVSLYNLKV